MDRGEISQHLRERIVAFAALRMRREVAEALAQEVLVLLDARSPSATSAEELVPVALQILYFKSSGTHEKSLRQDDTLRNLTKAVSTLGERCRELLRLKLLGKTYQEIQEEFNASSVGTVYAWDAHCRKHLLDRIGGSWGSNP